MAQMNGMEKRNFTNSTRNGGKMAEMRNNSAKSGMVGMSALRTLYTLHTDRHKFVCYLFHNVSYCEKCKATQQFRCRDWNHYHYKSIGFNDN